MCVCVCEYLNGCVFVRVPLGGCGCVWVLVWVCICVGMGVLVCVFCMCIEGMFVCTCIGLFE